MLAFHYRPNHEVVEPYAPPTWADGTDEEIAEAVAKADAGEINLSDYWAVGDTRSVDIASFSGNNTATHAAQTVEVVLMQEGLYQTINDKTVNFICGLKNALNDYEYMNTSSGTGTWNWTPLRTLCNGNFYNALPQSLKTIIKTAKVKVAYAVSNDNIFLPGEREVTGSYNSSRDAEGRELSQFTYYITAEHKFKRLGNSTANLVSWWLRTTSTNSDTTYFCCITGSGGIYTTYEYTGLGLVPHFCI